MMQIQIKTDPSVEADAAFQSLLQSHLRAHVQALAEGTLGRLKQLAAHQGTDEEREHWGLAGDDETD